MPNVTDTPPEIAEMIRTRLLALSGAERFLMGIRMCEAARRMVLAPLPSGLPESNRKRLLFERFYGMPLPTGSEVEGFEPLGVEKEDFCTAKGRRPSLRAQTSQFVEKGAEVYAKARDPEKRAVMFRGSLAKSEN